MTTTQFFTATSIDGFIADQNNSLDWLFEVEGEGPGPLERFAAFLADVGAMAMGATTYTWILEHEQMLEDPAKWTSWYEDRPCWVFTHRDLPLIPGADLRFVHGAVGPVHAQMVDAAAGRNIWLVGGGDLAGQFADAGQLDEIILSVAPVTLGAGAPLLPRRLTRRLRLAGAEALNSAFVELRYRVEGRQRRDEG